MNTPTSKAALKTVCIISIILIPLIIIIGFWWWAIFGISQPVGVATGITAFVFVLIALMSCGSFA